MALCADDIELRPLTRSRCLDARGFGADGAWHDENSLALRLSIVVFEVQTRLPYLTAGYKNYVFLGGRLHP